MKQIINSSLADICDAKILLVEDDPLNSALLNKALESFQNLYSVHCGEDAIEFCQKYPPDLVLLDVMMSGLGGHETCLNLRALKDMNDCPIIFLTSLNTEQDEIRCWESGATDFVAKPISPVTLIKRIQSHIRLKLQNPAQKALAIFDCLTGLRNRRFFDDYYQQQLNLSCRTNTDLSIVVINIDYFKKYNDFYGHVAGDLCLKLVAQILSGQLNRPSDIAVRYGGEEFALILPNTDIKGARCITNQIMAEFDRKAIPHKKSPFEAITVSAGLASLSTIHKDADLFTVADQSLYSVKQAGRNACT